VTTPDFSTPVSIDYTSRDFYALREDLIERVRARVAEWFGNDPADFGVALVEAFAYVGDIMGYYTDRVANEGSLLTATQRSSILALAAAAGYTPSGYSAATTTVRVVNSDTDAVELPAGTQFQGSYSTGDTVENVVFSLINELTVPAEGDASGLASHGEDTRYLYPAESPNDVSGELLGLSDGQPNQRFYLAESEVVDGSIRVFVQYGDSYGIWNQGTFLPDFGPDDPVYTVETDSEGRISVVFGDGVSGAIPAAFSAIKARYVIGGGVRGNIPANSLYSLYRVPELSDSEVASLSETLTVTNTDTGVGGSDPDSTDLIRRIASQTARANDRAVTLRDYSSLALLAENVAKVNSVASTSTSITVYVAPVRTTTLGDPYPLYDDDNTILGPVEWPELQRAVTEVLTNRRMVGVSVTVSPPTYVDVTCSVLYNLAPQFTSSEVNTALQTRLLDAFSYVNNNFGDIIYPEQVEAVLREVPGAVNVRVTELFRTSDTSNTRDILVAEPEQIFIFNPAELTVEATSSDAAISSLAFNTGTLSPTFTGEFFNYTLTVGAVSSVDITANVSSGATLTLNGNAATSGESETVATPTATTVVPIAVLAQDGITRRTYSITIVKA
jgi:hypothetical protein